MDRAYDIAAKQPGVAHAIRIVGFSGATFTNAPNAGAMFLVLDDFAKRAEDPRHSAAAIQGALFGKLAAIQDAFIGRGAAALGAGHRQCRRLPHDDRGPRRARARRRCRARSTAMMGRAAQTPGLQQVFSLFETSTPQLYLDIDRTKAQLLGRQHARRVQRAAGLSRLGLCQRLQPVRPHLPGAGAGRRAVSAWSRRTS